MVRIPEILTKPKVLIPSTVAIVAVFAISMLAVFNLNRPMASSDNADTPSTRIAAEPVEKEPVTKPNVKVEITPDAGTPKDEKTAIIVDLAPVPTTNDAATSNSNNTTAKAKTPKPIAHAVSIKPSKTYPASYTAKPGTYRITAIGTVNTDGSVTKAHTDQSLVTVTEPGQAQATANLYEEPSGIVPIPVKTQTIPADQVKPEDVTEIVTKTNEAVKRGDATLTGDAGKQLTDRLQANAKQPVTPAPAAPEPSKQEATPSANKPQPSAAPQQPSKPATSVCTPTTRQVPVYEKVWVPNIVTIVDQPEQIKEVDVAFTVTLHNNKKTSPVFYLSDPDAHEKKTPGSGITQLGKL